MKIYRSFTLMEVLTAVGLLGAFLVLSGPLTLHLIYAVGGRTETYDQLFLVSRVGDKVRSDLQGRPDAPVPLVLAVKPDLLRIGIADKTVEYRIDDTRVQRAEAAGGTSQITAVWHFPCSSLTFSRHPGKQGAVLIGLHWRLGKAGDRFTQARKTELEMDVAARESVPGKEEK